MSFKELFLTPDPKITNRAGGLKPLVKIFGVPFDATCTYRSGARFGPNSVRQAFQNIEIYSHHLDVDLEALELEDLGNLRQTSSVQQMVDSVQKVVKELISEESPFAILGGEHSLTFGSCSMLPSDTAIAVFDAHLDLRDEYADLRLSHATFLRRLLELRKTATVVHVGSRAATAEEWRFANDAGLTTISCDTIFAVDGSQKLFTDFMIGFDTVYVSVDLDVLDPAFAPGVSNPEPAGLSSYQLLQFLYSLRGKKIVGFDIVELSPPYDNGSASVVAAKLLAEISCLSSLK